VGSLEEIMIVVEIDKDEQLEAEGWVEECELVSGV
jgi:hypothetical protein